MGSTEQTSRRWIVTEHREIIVESPFELTASSAMGALRPDEPQPTRLYAVSDHTTRTAEIAP